MRRKQRCAIVWMLVVAMAFSPSMIYAQPPTAAPRAEKPKLDAGYITPESVAAVSLYPQSVLIRRKWNSCRWKSLRPRE